MLTNYDVANVSFPQNISGRHVVLCVTNEKGKSRHVGISGSLDENDNSEHIFNRLQLTQLLMGFQDDDWSLYVYLLTADL